MADEDVGEIRGEDHRDVFEVVEKLGEGSYGSVWKAREVRSDGGGGRIFAAKRVAVLQDSDTAQLRREIEFMQSCRSPHVVRYYGSYAESGALWILMEYMSGGSVADLLKSCKTTLDELQLSVVAKAVARGLEFLHASHRIHRDLKGGNVLVNSEGRCKLADFGVSGQLADTMAKRYTMVGSPYWISPEVILDAGYNESADIWSLGITCIEMAEGRPPYADMHPMRAIFMIPSRNPPTLADPGKWSPAFQDFLAKCLQKAPDSRATAKELLEHPFLAAAPDDPSCLLPLLQRQEAVIREVGRDKALGFEPAQPTATADLTRSLCATGATFDTLYDSDDDEDDDDDGTIVYK